MEILVTDAYFFPLGTYIFYVGGLPTDFYLFGRERERGRERGRERE
jgi:hypothetical protein